MSAYFLVLPVRLQVGRMHKTLQRIDVQEKAIKFSPMAKISKIIITGRNEVNVNLQKQNIHAKSKPHHKMLTESTL